MWRRSVRTPAPLHHAVSLSILHAPLMAAAVQRANTMATHRLYESLTTASVRVEEPKRLAVPQRPLEYKEALAYSLFLYAKKDHRFAKTLKQLVRTLPLFRQSSAEITIEPPSIEMELNILVPPDTTSALRRAQWLLERLNEGDLRESLRATRLLSAWGRVKEKEDPKAIVIGMIVGVIPPVGMGHIKRKKKMSLVVRRGLVGKEDALLAGGAAPAALGVLSRAIEMAGGNMKKLEPELRDLFFGGGRINFYEADRAALINMKSALRETGILHETIEQEGELALIAVCPSADLADQEFYFGVTPLAGYFL